MNEHGGKQVEIAASKRKVLPMMKMQLLYFLKVRSVVLLPEREYPDVDELLRAADVVWRMFALPARAVNFPAFYRSRVFPGEGVSDFAQELQVFVCRF